MAVPVPLKNASDSYVSSKKPNENFGQVQKLFLAASGAGNERQAYLYFGIPSGMSGKTVDPADLVVYSGGPGWSGSVTLTAQLVSAKFAARRITYNNRPGTTGATVQVTQVDAPDGTPWVFDLKPLLQTVANGAAWYGIRITANGTTGKWLYSAQAENDEYRPTLTVAWSDAPETPDNLTPGKGKAVSVSKPTLQWDFTDPAGDTTLAAASIRLFSSEANALANSSQILQIDTALDNPQYDLNDSAYGGLADDASLWWRVLNTDGAGLDSGWSDYEVFVRKTKGSLAITNPAAGSPAFVNESTPPFSWTFTGRTQVKYQVIIVDPDFPAVYLWDTGITTSTDTAVTPPRGILKEPGKTYRVIVRIWDDQSRIATPGDPIYTEATRDFEYQLGAESPVTGLSGTADASLPSMVLSWTSATAPDYFVILRDGVEVDTVEPVDVFVSGTSYSYTDTSASPRKSHTWAVARKVNNVTSDSNPTVVGTVKSLGPLLSRLDGSKKVMFLNPDIRGSKAESSDVHYILGNAAPILITQSIRGYEGTISGVLASEAISGITAEDMADNLDWHIKHRGVTLRLIWANLALEVFIRNATFDPVTYPDGTIDYEASLEFYETGF